MELWCRERCLVRAPLTQEVGCLGVEAVAGAAGAQDRRASSPVGFGSVEQQYVLQKQQGVTTTWGTKGDIEAESHLKSTNCGHLIQPFPKLVKMQ